MTRLESRESSIGSRTSTGPSAAFDLYEIFGSGDDPANGTRPGLDPGNRAAAALNRNTDGPTRPLDAGWPPALFFCDTPLEPRNKPSLGEQLDRIVSDERRVQQAADLLFNAAMGINRDARSQEFGRLRSETYEQIRRTARSDAEAREKIWEFDDNVTRAVKRLSDAAAADWYRRYPNDDNGLAFRRSMRVEFPTTSVDGPVRVMAHDNRSFVDNVYARVDSNPGKDWQEKTKDEGAKPDRNYDTQARQIRETIRNPASTSDQMSADLRRIIDAVPREDRAAALMQSFHHFGWTKYIQNTDGEASIRASVLGGRHNGHLAEVKVDVPEDKAVIPSKDTADAAKKCSQFLLEGDGLRAHAVLNGVAAGDRLKVLQDAVLQTNNRIGNCSALIIEELPDGKVRASVAALHPASGRDFDRERDVSLSVILPADRAPAPQADATYQKQAEELKAALMKWDGAAAYRVMQTIPPEDRAKVLAQVSHRSDCSQYFEEADGTARIGAGRGIFFPMEEGPWVKKDRVNVVQVRVAAPGDNTVVKPKDATEGAQWIAAYIDAHDGIYAHRVLNNFPPEERRAILEAGVKYWNDHYNTARHIDRWRLEIKTERLPNGQERLSIGETLGIVVPVRR